MKPRLAIVVVLALGVSTAAAAPLRTSALRKFSYSGAGTNYVNIHTGEVRELWKGHADSIGKITTHVGGWIQFPNPPALAFHGSMVIVDRKGDVLIGACSGTGVLPLPNGQEDWTCDDQGGTGKFKHSRGQWTLHIVIDRVSLDNGIQTNRFTEKGAGQISWDAGARG